ncbi:MAG: hypothetical protein J2P57_19170, partial [Acidimicrobiaceae bacterium]|nr:hypothetical protein [Acidimicrobiaceae bacterium]
SLSQLSHLDHPEGRARLLATVPVVVATPSGPIREHAMRRTRVGALGKLWDLIGSLRQLGTQPLISTPIHRSGL